MRGSLHTRERALIERAPWPLVSTRTRPEFCCQNPTRPAALWHQEDSNEGPTRIQQEQGLPPPHPHRCPGRRHSPAAQSDGASAPLTAARTHARGPADRAADLHEAGVALSERGAHARACTALGRALALFERHEG